MLETQREGPSYQLPPAFGHTSVRSGRSRTVRLVGELDVATAPRARRALGAALALDDDVVVVDLRGLVFIDVVGVRVILDVGSQSCADGRRVVVIRGPAPVDRAFALTGVDELIEFVDLRDSQPPSQQDPDRICESPPPIELLEAMSNASSSGGADRGVAARHVTERNDAARS